MRVAIHQPNFFPWLGFFYKIQKSDVFVLLNHVQYSKGELTNRVAIKNGKEKSWLTVPVLTKGKGKQSICEVKTNDTVNWKKKHLSTIKQAYRKTPFFQKYFELFEELYSRKFQSLSQFNEEIIRVISDELGIKTNLVNSSTLDVSGSKSELLVQIVKKLNGDEYLSGLSAKVYNDEEYYKAHGIKLAYTEFVHPKYRQVSSGPFIEGLSAMDYLLNCGSKDVSLW